VTPQSTDADDQFLAARLLFVCYAHPAADLLPDSEHGALAEIINAATARHASTGEMEPTLACTATLQLILVLAAKPEAQVHDLFASLNPILEMFDRAPIRNPPLEPPMSLLIDCLATLVSHDDALAITSELSCWPPFNGDKLVNVLGLAMQAYQPEVLETRITPLVSLLFKISQLAPAETKERLRARLLPSDQDRTQVLGRGDSLSHRLVRISTEAVLPVFKNSWPTCSWSCRITTQNGSFIMWALGAASACYMFLVYQPLPRTTATLARAPEGTTRGRSIRSPANDGIWKPGRASLR
jgi:hypothetical protein